MTDTKQSKGDTLDGDKPLAIATQLLRSIAESRPAPSQPTKEKD